jgi:uncharacterized protein YndB with AHSA1/START domain
VPYAFTLTATIAATPLEIYDAWLDSIAHSEMTQAEASMSNEIGADISACNGYITGRNLELVPGERIVQTWRTAEFSEEHEDSVITLTLEEIEDGTLLTLAHSNVPDGQTGYELGGWEENYFEPMTEYFAERTGPNISEAPTRAAPSTKRAAGRKKAKRAAPRAKPTARAKATASKRKSGQLVAANAGRKSATKTRSKGTEVSNSRRQTAAEP